MWKLVKWIVGLGCCLFVLVVSDYVHPEAVCVLLSLVIFLVLTILLARALMKGLLEWRRSSRLWPVPVIVCLAFILSTRYFASPVGRYISHGRMEKRLGHYDKVVAEFKAGVADCKDACDGNVGLLGGTTLPAGVRDIWAAPCGGSNVVVLFRMDTDVPLLHEGYMYKDYDDSSGCGKKYGTRELAGSRFPYVRRVEGNWYRFSDQPGF